MIDIVLVAAVPDEWRDDRGDEDARSSEPDA